jgi:type II secretory pathway pseudopilin PulG
MNKGLTIIETLVFIAIFTLAIGAVSGLLVYFYKSNAYVIQQAYTVNSARKGVEVMTREIREATYSDTGAYPVVESQDQSFSFYSDIDRDNKIEKVRYFLEGSNFKKGEIEATGDSPRYDDDNEVISILSDNVRNGTQKVFTYYNASSTEVADLTQLTDIKLVKVSLIVNIDPNRPPEEFTLTSSAQIRNLYEY